MNKRANQFWIFYWIYEKFEAYSNDERCWKLPLILSQKVELIWNSDRFTNQNLDAWIHIKLETNQKFLTDERKKNFKNVEVTFHYDKKKFRPTIFIWAAEDLYQNPVPRVQRHIQLNGSISDALRFISRVKSYPHTAVPFYSRGFYDNLCSKRKKILTSC